MSKPSAISKGIEMIEAEITSLEARIAVLAEVRERLYTMTGVIKVAAEPKKRGRKPKVKPNSHDEVTV